MPETFYLAGLACLEAGVYMQWGIAPALTTGGAVLVGSAIVMAYVRGKN